MPLGRAIVTLDPASFRRLARQLFALELRDLVDVARLERRVFVGRRMLDVAVDADRAAVHDAPDARGGRGLDEPADGGRVDGPVGLGRNARLTGRSRRCGTRRRRRRRPARAPAGSRRSPRTSSMPAAARSGRVGRVAHQRADRLPSRRAAARARWPPVKPVAPVTKTVSAPPDRSAHDRDRRPEQTQQSEAVEDALRSRREPPRSDHLVQLRSADELPVDRPDRGTASRPARFESSRAGRRDTARCVRPTALNIRRTTDCSERGARGRRVVEDDEPVRHAAELGERTAASRACA